MGRALRPRTSADAIGEAASAKLVNRISPLFQDDLRVHDAVTTENGDLLAATSRGLAKSHDAGLTWQLVPGTLDGTTVSALCRHPTRQRESFLRRCSEGFF